MKGVLKQIDGIWEVVYTTDRYGTCIRTVTTCCRLKTGGLKLAGMDVGKPDSKPLLYEWGHIGLRRSERARLWVG